MTDPTSGAGGAAAFATVAAVHFIAVLSPGPDMAVVLRQSFREGRGAGVLTSLGVGAGNLTHVLYALLGLGVLIARTPWLMGGMRWAAAVYLTYLGVRGLLAKAGADAGEPFGPGRGGARPPARSHFGIGFLTSALNPKATLFYLAVFTAMVDLDTAPTSFLATLAVYLPCATAAIFSGVSCIAGYPAFRVRYKKFGHWLDRAIGAALLGLAAKLAFFP